MFEFEMSQISGLQPSLLANQLALPAKTLTLLFSKIKVLPSGCWEWTGAKRKGYGVVHIRSVFKSAQLAHRICYQLVHGPVASEFPLHHKVEDGCIGPSCCNPNHLLKTTAAEHVRDLTPGSAAYIGSHRDTCQAGHPYTIESTRIVKGGSRQCRICDKIRAQEKRDALRVRPKYAKDPVKLKTHCFRGHPLEGDNVRMVPSPTGPQKCCLACEKIRLDWYRDRDEYGYLDPPTAIQMPTDRCKRGHLMEGDNVYFHSDGTRRSCKACRALFTKKGKELGFPMAPPRRLPLPLTPEEMAELK